MDEDSQPSNADDVYLIEFDVKNSKSTKVERCEKPSSGQKRLAKVWLSL